MILKILTNFTIKLLILNIILLTCALTLYFSISNDCYKILMIINCCISLYIEFLYFWFYYKLFNNNLFGIKIFKITYIHIWTLTIQLVFSIIFILKIPIKDIITYLLLLIICILILLYELYIMIYYIMDYSYNNIQLNQVTVQNYGSIQNTIPYQNKFCAICYIDFENEDNIAKLTCNHTFHEECIKEWFKYKQICPYCNK